MARRIDVGPGRALLLVYGVFALSASVRAGYQLVTKFADAPLAYVLSAFAAAVYVVATAALARNLRLTALVACSIEMVGVLAVGALSYARPRDFPDATVWSHFGQGYGLIPVVLPVLGLAWLFTSWRSGRPGTAGPSRSPGRSD